MVKIQRLLITIFTLSLIGCGEYDLTYSSNNEGSKNIDCLLDSPEPYEMVVPVIPDTGVMRKPPTNIISREDFVKALRNSNLWGSLKDKFVDNEYYTDTFTFENTQGNIRILGENQIYSIIYSFNNTFDKNKYGHQLTEAEQSQITDTINLVTGDYKKSKDIFNELYSSYLENINKNIMLDNGYNYHSYLINNNIIYEIWGIKEVSHPIKECRFDMLEKLTIS